MMPSIGASFANSQTNRSGGFFQPIHATGASRASQRNDITDDNSAEATAKTDMGGGLFGGGGGEGGGLGLGGLVSGVASALGLGKKSGGGTIADDGTWSDTGSGGPKWGLILLLAGCAVGVAVLLFGFLRKD